MKGLSTAEAQARRARFGKNEMIAQRRHHFLVSLWNVAREPMFILLAVACVLYFFLGEWSESLLMLVSILFVAGIEIYQESKSERALELLRKFTQAQVRVLRDDAWKELPIEELVPGDVVSLSEGERVPADAIVLQQNDFHIEEAVLTGESLAVEKSEGNTIFQGTSVAAGQGIVEISATGNLTELGKLGTSVDNIEASPTPLQLQIRKFVRGMGILGVVTFALVFVLNFWLTNDIWLALLFSLTVAMALIPEEIPVAFSTFMALGAYRMTRVGILAKQPKTVESLGSATVICLDKTGTITENKMSVAETVHFFDEKPASNSHILELAWWASEPQPIDAMERAIQQQIEQLGYDPRAGFELVHEYPLSGKPPMMTHLWQHPTQKTWRIVAKGAVERILHVSKVSVADRDKVLARAEAEAARGCRVLGLASCTTFQGIENRQFPATQDDFEWEFEGIIAFFDPPKKDVGEALQKFREAGIRVMMITGDHATTAQNIARMVGLSGWQRALTGDEVMSMDESQLKKSVKEVNIFARMFPQAKLRIVETLQSLGETVAMSGDGVNDAPALKSAQIGVAMGKQGTDLAKSAASLVLLEDNLSSMADAIRTGRQIYDNLRKAIRYIISIHLPIVLAVLVPLIFGWQYPHILMPLHVIFLELVMDPIAAIAFENEPPEPNVMQKPPRSGKASLFSWHEVGSSLLQGFAIGVGVLWAYQHAIHLNLPENTVRSFVFSTMVFSNVFLTLTNRSFFYPIWKTIFYKNRWLPLILGISILMLAMVLYVPPVANMFKLLPLTPYELFWCAGVAFVSVFWIEIWKAGRFFKRRISATP